MARHSEDETPAAARELLRELEQEFVPMKVRAEGLGLWHYLGAHPGS